MVTLRSGGVICHSALSRLSPSWLTSARRRRREDTVDSGALLGSGADKGASGPHTLGHGTAQRKPRTKDAIQRGWRERREKEQRDDRETGRQTQREMENRETERKYAERNEIDGDRNGETEILRDKEEKLETNSVTERQTRTEG